IINLHTLTLNTTQGIQWDWFTGSNTLGPIMVNAHKRITDFQGKLRQGEVDHCFDIRKVTGDA
ncbi:MAG: hypothetical protein EBW35_06025, partial [Rhodobacterales bacterium]|nr:hypothetical protein [Rhodobacterales bacterium]